MCVCVYGGLIFFSCSSTRILGNLSSEAVAHIHRLLIAHTDLKPANACFKRSWHFPVA